MAPRSGVDDLAGTLGETHLAPVLQRAVPDPRRPAGLRVDIGDVGDLDRELLVDDAAGIPGRGLGVPLHRADAFDDDAVLGRQHALHLAGLALVAAGDHDHLVAL